MDLFTLLSEVNKNLASEFRSRQPDPATFVLLEKVFDPAWRNSLSDGDKKVVEEICKTNANRLEELITEKIAMVGSELAPYLARIAAHYRIIRLAHAGDLGKDPTNFRKYLYPRQIDGVMALQIVRLKARCEVLRSTPASDPGSMPPLVIPKDDDHILPEWPNPPRKPFAVI